MHYCEKLVQLYWSSVHRGTPECKNEKTRARRVPVCRACHMKRSREGRATVMQRPASRRGLRGPMKSETCVFDGRRTAAPGQAGARAKRGIRRQGGRAFPESGPRLLSRFHRVWLYHDTREKRIKWKRRLRREGWPTVSVRGSARGRASYICDSHTCRSGALAAMARRRRQRANRPGGGPPTSATP